jgi:hypothetical protein
MTIVLQLLQEVDPAISASMAADLRAALVAINQQVEVDPASADWSLNSWWQWLEDEGYNRDPLLATLQRLGASRLDAAPLADLVAACQAHGDDPHGLEWVQALIGDLDAELIGLFHTLEAESLVEDLQLSQTAGGMSQAGKWTTGLGIGLGVPILALIVWNCKRRGNSVEGLVEQSVDQTNAVVHQQVRLVDNIALDAVNDPEPVIQLIDAAALEKGLARSTLIKSAANYTYDDIVAHAKSLTERHLRQFAVNDYDQVIRNDVLKNLEDNKYSSLQSWISVSRKNFEPGEAEKFLEGDRGKEYVQESINFLKKYGSDRITLEYKYLITAEVNEAKAAKKAAEAQGLDVSQYEFQLVQTDLKKNAGRFLPNIDQAVDDGIEIERHDVRDGIIEEEILGEEFERSLLHDV